MVEMWPNLLEMAFVLPNSRWSGAQADTEKPFETASSFICNEKSQCDFEVSQKGKVTHSIQVCYHISDENFAREYAGLIHAMDFFNLDHRVVVTENQRDRFEENGKVVELIPSFEYLSLPI